MTNRMSELSGHLALNARRAALSEGPHLFQCRHSRIARKRRQQRAVRPAQLHGILSRFAAEQPIKKARRKAVSATHAIQHVQFSCWSRVSFAVDPRHGAPAMTVG